MRDPNKLWYVRAQKPKSEEDIIKETLQRLEIRAKDLERGLDMPDIPEDIKALIRFTLEELDMYKHVFKERTGEEYVSVRKEILSQMTDCIRRVEDLQIM